MPTREQSLGQLQADDLKELAGTTATPALSIYLPTGRANVEPQENSLRLKAQLGEARTKLQERKIKSRDIDDLLEPLLKMLKNNDFWMRQREGLAIFRSADMLRTFSVAVDLTPATYVADSFVLKPLLGAASPLGEFYVLGLSQNSIRLLRCSRDMAEELDLSSLDIPLSLDEALRYDDLQKPDLQFHRGSGPNRAPAASTGRGRGEPTFHGHGDDGTDVKTQLLRFFQMVDPGIRKLLNGSRAPLILAGVEYERPIYKEASDYNNIAERGIDGNPEGLKIEEVVAKARPIYESWLTDLIAEQAERFGDMSAHGKGSSDLDDILTAAHEGRVDTLFIKEGAEIWGYFDLRSKSSLQHDEQELGDVELYDLAARQTILSAGQAYLLSEAKMIGGGSVAALYRY